MTRLFAVCLLAVLAVPGLEAQVRQDSTPLAPIVITATRSPQPESTLANSVTVLQGDDLRRAGITTVADALRAVNGAAVVQQSSYGSVTSLFLRGGQSNYVRVLVDGVPINQPGGALDLSNVTTAGVERIELVRGPTSVLYGSDAVTGVLQIFTRRGRGPARLHAEGRGGSYGSSDFAAELSGGSAKLGATAGMARSASDGLYDFNNRYENWTGSGALRFQPDQKTDINFTGRYNDAEFHTPTDGSGVPADSNQYQTSRGSSVAVDAGRFLSKVLEARMLLGFHQEKNIFDDSPDNAGDTIFGTFHSDALVDRKSADLRVNLHTGAATILTLGGAVENERERSSNSFSPQQTIERTNRAAYAQAVTSLSNRFWLQGGVRLEDNQAFGSFVTFRAGGTMRVAPHTRLRANVGSAFKEPTFIEQYSAGFSTGNPDLNPERSTSVEAGIEQDFAADRATLSATVFGQQFRDMIQYDGGAATPPAPNYYNIAGANASGVEAMLAYRLSGALRVRAEYTWLHTEVSDSGYGGQQYAVGERLIRRPTSSGVLSADITPLGRFAGGMRWILVGTRSDLDFGNFPATRVELPGYGRVDLWADVALLQGRSNLSLTARVENAADQPYQEVFGYPALGRRILVGGRIDAGR